MATLMDACRKYGIQRYHQVSTDEVYGDLPLDRPDLFFTEETPIHTSSPYSSSKAAADLLVMAYYRTYGLPVSISRCSNNYGSYHFPEKLIPLMIANALNDKPLPVYREGLNVRDRLYVEDCIYRSDRAHCTEYQCIPSVSSVHAFRKAEQSFDLLDYERSYLKNCVNGAFMPPEAMPLTRILRYETHIVIVLCSPERMHSLTVQYALLRRYLQKITVKPLTLLFTMEELAKFTM